MGWGAPDALDLMVAVNYANMALNLIDQGQSANMVVLRRGTYTSVPVETILQGVKRVDVEALYDDKRYRPLVRQGDHRGAEGADLVDDLGDALADDVPRPVDHRQDGPWGRLDPLDQVAIERQHGPVQAGHDDHGSVQSGGVVRPNCSLGRLPPNSSHSSHSNGEVRWVASRIPFSTRSIASHSDWILRCRASSSVSSKSPSSASTRTSSCR